MKQPEVDSFYKNVLTLQRKIIKARPHENEHKILPLTCVPYLLRPVFAMPKLYFYKESASGASPIRRLLEETTSILRVIPTHSILIVI